MFNINPVQDISKKSIAKYMLLPGILPRLKNLGLSFNKILFVFVQILGAVKLIDQNHPCLRHENIGRYAFSEIILMAWSNVHFDRKHILQTTMFFSVMASIVILIGMALSASGYAFAAYSGVAHAQYFSLPSDTGIAYDAKNDWAFNFLAHIFGGKKEIGIDFWGDGGTNGPINPWYTSILIGMLKVYSKALLSILLFMILYIILTALADAARTGKPFGEKFDPLWAPIRFALAIGLLVPLTGGYNGAQLLVFQSAAWGSNLATNIWQRSISAASKDDTRFIGASINDPGYRFLRDMFLVNLCVTSFNTFVDQHEFKVTDYSNKISPTPVVSMDGKTLTYSFGNSDAPDFCGQVVVPNPTKYMGAPDEYVQGGGGSSDGFLPNVIANKYNSAITMFLPSATNNLMAKASVAVAEDYYCSRDKQLTKLTCDGTNCSTQVQDWVYQYWKQVLGRDVSDASQDYFMAGYQDSLNNYNSWLFRSIKSDAQYGWASAGAFYMRMAYALSMLDDVVNEQPHVSKLPTNMYKVYAMPDNILSNDAANIDCGMKDGAQKCEKYAAPYLLSELLHKGADWFAMSPKLANSDVNNLAFYQKVGPQEWEAAVRMPDNESAGMSDLEGVWSSIWSAMKRPLYQNIQLNGKSMHPLGQVITWGTTLVGSSELSFALAIAITVAEKFIPVAKEQLEAAARILVTIGKMLMVPGFILMFVVPFLPFLYFTFAVIEWVAGIVEAVIGIPLWALTFVTAEGDLDAETKQGAKILFDIVLRPTIIVMSLVSSILIFTASVNYLNEAMNIYTASANTSNAGLGDGNISAAGALATIASPIGGMGMIFIYMFVVYTLATSCFKLIDAIPGRFGRWLGLEGGFGEMTGEGNALAFAAGTYVAGQGIGIAVSSAQAADTHFRRNPKSDKEQMAEFQAWRESDKARVDSENATVADENIRIRAANVILRKNGMAEIPERQMQNYAPDRDISYFATSREAGEKYAKKQGDYFYGNSQTGVQPTGSSGGGSGGGGSGSGSGSSSGGGSTGGSTGGNRVRLTPDELSASYATLGVSPDISKAELGKLKRQMLGPLHPDRNPDPKAAELYDKLVKAFINIENSRRGS